MNFSAYSIKNPLVAILLFTLMTVAGIVAFQKMKIQQFPDIDLPAIVVTITMPGAAPAQLESDVAKKVENKLSGIEGVKHLRTKIQTGAVTVVGEFRLEKDIQEALDEVRSAVGEVQGDLPAAANQPIISKVSTVGFPVVSYSVASNSMTDAQLSWWVDNTLSRRLSNLEGVGQIGRIGGIYRQIIVAADADKLGSWSMPISNLSRQIALLWQDVSGGTANVAGGSQTIRVVGAGSRLEDLKALQISTPTGAARLDSLADIYDGAAEQSSEAWLEDQSVVAFNVTRSRGASEVSMVNLIDEELELIANENPDITIHKIYDNAAPIQADYQASMQMLIEGCILAVLVVFAFLRNWRATFVTATALPLSIIPTFLAMHFFGFSLNMISLLALSLVIGVLVDDAIVEVENIMRHLRMGKTPFEAAMEAADEIGLAVVATTFTLIAVFLPTAFMSGIVGQFFRQFGWTAAISIFMSLLVARLITPMMAAYILRPEKNKIEKPGRVMLGYLSMVRWTLKNRLLTLFVTLVIFVGSVMPLGQLPVAFIPDNDINQTQVTLELTPDADLSDTTRIAKWAKDKINTVKGVSSVFISSGSETSRGFMSSSGLVNKATLNISLELRGTRPTKSQIEADIREVLQSVPAARFQVGLLAGGEAGYGFSLTSIRPDLLDETVAQVVKEIGSIPKVSATTSEALPKPEITVIPNRLAIAERNVNIPDVANTLRIATMGDYEQALPKMNFDTRQIPIVIRLPKESKEDLSVLKALYVPSANGQPVRLNEVVGLEFSTGPSEISRLDRQRSIKITAESQLPLGELIAKVNGTQTLSNLPTDVSLVPEGQAESMKELFEGFVLAMGVGIFCIFAVLILLFHRILQPFTILMALPLSIGGAFVGLLLTGSSLSMPSMIGFIMLMGIATKNSILLVDYAILAQNAGKTQPEAIIDACQKRARPIIMTTIAMGAGMLPLVFGWGGGRFYFSSADGSSSAWWTDYINFIKLNCDSCGLYTDG